MKKLSFFLLLILVLEITISVDSQNPSVMKFVLQWPPTFCIITNSPKPPTPPARCKEPIPQHSFTLHGLWPADKNGFSLRCDREQDPNWNQVFTPIENKLMTFWPPLRENAQNWDLWKHEWRDHGVCGRTTPKVYFDTAIKINNMISQGDLFYYLKTSGIIACDSLSFTKTEIVEAIRKVFGVPSTPPLDVYLTCIPLNTTHIYLHEVTLCTDFGGTNFITCPSRAAPTSCSTGARIMLPHPKPQPSPPPPPPRRPPAMLQEDVDMIYPMFEKS